MNYLVTGGAGFIGSHLCELLLDEGHRVCAIDDLSTGSVNNVAHLRSNPNFTCVFESIFERQLMAELVDNADTIVHLAAAVGVNLIVQDPVRTIETNILGSELVLKLAAKKQRKVLIASTSEIYGKSSKVPFGEDDDMVFGASTRSRWSYACSKAIDEFLALAYFKQRGTPVIIVRLFNTVGPRQTGHYGMVLPRFTRQALDGAAITVYGDGSQSRCFGYVGDIVGAIAKLTREPAAVGEIFNLGNNEEVTINGLAELVREVARSESPIVHIPYKDVYGDGFEDMPRRVPNLEKAFRVIGYRPTLNTRQTIEKVVNHMSRPVEVHPIPPRVHAETEPQRLAAARR